MLFEKKPLIKKENFAQKCGFKRRERPEGNEQGEDTQKVTSFCLNIEQSIQHSLELQFPCQVKLAEVPREFYADVWDKLWVNYASPCS